MLCLSAFLVIAEEQCFVNCVALVQINVDDFASVASPKVQPNDLVVSPVPLTKGPLKHVKFDNLYLVVRFFSTSAVLTKSSPYYLQYVKNMLMAGTSFLNAVHPCQFLRPKIFERGRSLSDVSTFEFQLRGNRPRKTRMKCGEVCQRNHENSLWFHNHEERYRNKTFISKMTSCTRFRIVKENHL